MLLLHDTMAIDAQDIKNSLSFKRFSSRREKHKSSLIKPLRPIKRYVFSSVYSLKAESNIPLGFKKVTLPETTIVQPCQTSIVASGTIDKQLPTQLPEIQVTQTEQDIIDLPVQEGNVGVSYENQTDIKEEQHVPYTISETFISTPTVGVKVLQTGHYLFRSLFSWNVFKELFKFATVTIVTFVIVLVAMNFSAYYQMATYWMSKWKGETTQDVKNLQALVDDGNRQVELLRVGEIGVPFLPKAGTATPSVTIDVLPPDNRIVIPKIGKNIPIVEIPITNLIAQNWKGLEEDIQAGLKSGVVHYPGTALPGQIGNFFVTGHSSYYFWEHSKYKDIFALLPEVDIGDRVTIYYNQKKYVYDITDKKEVSPSNTEVLKQTNDKRITLMTCVPVGTDLNRLILVGTLVENK